MPTHAHLTVEAFALHLLLQRAQSLIDIVVANLNLDDDRSPEHFPRATFPAVLWGNNKGSLRRGLREPIRETGRFGKASNERLGHGSAVVYLRRMTLRKIAPLGQPVLLRRAVPVQDPTDPATRALLCDMAETLADARGLGLAAPQVYAGVRLVLAHLPDADGAVDRAAAPLVLVNPTLTPLDEATDLAFEGCLSIPGLRGIVRRSRRVGLAALDSEGRPVEREAEGLFARILQHEVDHLDGILYTHRLEDPRHLAFDGEVQALAAYLAEQQHDAGDER